MAALQVEKKTILTRVVRDCELFPFNVILVLNYTFNAKLSTGMRPYVPNFVI